MNGPFVPDKQPPYLNECKNMDFDQLRTFIDEALKRLSDPVLDAASLRSKAEFDTLFEVLSARSEALRQQAPEPALPRPTYDVPYASPRFEPSEELDFAYKRRESIRKILDGARFDPWSRRYVEHLESELRPLEREIAERELREEQEQEKRHQEYRTASEEYCRRLRLWQETIRKEGEWLERMAFRERIVQRVRGDIERKFKPRPT